MSKDSIELVDIIKSVYLESLNNRIKKDKKVIFYKDDDKDIISKSIVDISLITDKSNIFEELENIRKL